MKTAYTKWGYGLLACFLFVLTAFSQFENEGKKNVWTSKRVQVRHQSGDHSLALCKIRISTDSTYDRITFEFNAGRPDFILQYLPSNIYPSEGEDRKITIAGSRYFVLSIYGMGLLDNLPCHLKTYPKKKLKYPALRQMMEGEWFEGIRDFIFGVNGARPFRVKELTHPSRLIIDIRH